ncbi:MAG: beta-propeller fold lactonase family protein [Planctomycetes bacterium]|nr:beta-propeller fold lactonase family protein [Planctomycetota bacterium]
MSKLILLAPLLFFPGCASAPKVAEVWPGSYLIVLEKDAAQAVVVEPNGGFVKHVFATETGPHEVCVSRNGQYAVIANYGDGTVRGHTLSVFDLVEERRERLIDLAPHERPHGIAFLDRRSTVLVTSETSNAVLEVDLRSGKVTRAIPTGAELSHMLALSPDKKRAYTSNAGSGSISVLDLEQGTLAHVVEMGTRPEAIDVAPNGEIWVGDNEENKVVVIDPVSLKVIAVIHDLRLPIRLAVAPDGSLVAVSCAATGEIALIDARTKNVATRIPLERSDAPSASLPPMFEPGSPVPVGILIDPDSRYAFVSLAAADRVAVIDLEERRVRTTIAAPGGPDGLAWAFRRAPPSRSW